MAHEVIMPALGMAQDTGRIVSWMKAEGEPVAAGDMLFEVETDKTVVEVEALFDGYLTDVQADAGDDVPVGQVIALISDTAEGSGADPVARDGAASLTPTQPPDPSEAQTAIPSAPMEHPAMAKPASQSQSQSQTGGRVLASPKARKMAAEAGLDLSRLADAGIAQPYHAADIARLRDVPAAQPSAAVPHAAISHIGSTIPATATDDFMERMRTEGGVDLSATQVVVSLAAAALRHATEGQSLLIAASDSDRTRHIHVDPDRQRLSTIEGVESDDDAMLEIDVLEPGFLTTVTVSDRALPSLVVARQAEHFHLTLTFSSAHLSTDQAIDMMQRLSRNLADPMLALI